MHPSTAPIHESRPRQEPDLLRVVYERYGGLARWRGIRHLDITFSAGGLAFVLKGQRGTLKRMRARIVPSPRHVTFVDYPRPGLTGQFLGDRVWIVRKDGGVESERLHPRQAFSRFRQRLWWDALDLLYFTSYAIWHYACFPFLLGTPGTVARETDAGPHRHLRCLEATFAEDFHAHSRVNRYYVDAHGLLRRHHYTAEVIGQFAKAAHLCEGYRSVAGLPIASERVVLPEFRRHGNLPFPRLVWIRIDDVTIARRSGEAS